MGLLKSMWNLLGAVTDNIAEGLEESSEEIDRDIEKLSNKLDQRAQAMRNERLKHKH